MATSVRPCLEVLSAQSLLTALGLGSSPGALPLAAATKWVLKDGVGSIATLLAGSIGGQRLTLVHFSAQLQRFLWDRGCI